MLKNRVSTESDKLEDGAVNSNRKEAKLALTNSHVYPTISDRKETS
jgi:hypothetical protein